ncbi:uncharacterized protein TNIN_53741 [Trichonephila inaurata madagascariensis]|uniref:Uncharacterized protein n=1 Tax=Trichonephila inaurata madagascariensis TaxID=2747483 RepID=A0A8X6XGJ0_9ARAC|nr:uncharacterized protein TNIN_53741 [Trichonephila inaurata madagascariensis]
MLFLASADDVATKMKHCHMSSIIVVLRRPGSNEGVMRSSKGLGRLWPFEAKSCLSTKRLDIDAVIDGKLFIIDVTILFDNRLASFEEFRNTKIQKYKPLASFLHDQGYKEVFIAPIVVGSLGAWDTNNDQFLHLLCAPSYLKLLGKLSVPDCIRWSRDIYIEHLTGHRQFDNGNQDDLADENFVNYEYLFFSVLFVVSLESLGRTQEKYGDFLTPLVESCLPEEILVAWERKRNTETDTERSRALEHLVTFLRLEVQGEEMLHLAKSGFGTPIRKRDIPTEREKPAELMTASALGLVPKSPQTCIKLDSATTKKHPGFDASPPEKGKPSLNDCLCKGINLIELIPDILDRFRIYPIGIVADIEKAFLMLSVAPKDRLSQIFFP